MNDAPVVSGPVDLGKMLEDGTFRITTEQLLANASDVDGDELFVRDLKLSSGQGSITDNGDGSWTFAPAKDWNGDSDFSYTISEQPQNITGTESAAAMRELGRDGQVAASKSGDLIIRGLEGKIEVINRTNEQ